MKKIIKILLILVLIFIIGFGYYFIRVKNFNISKNVYVEEKDKLNKYLDNISRPLTMMIISNCIDNNYNNGKYDLTKNENLLDNIKYKQQFTIEYYIHTNKNYDKFLLVNQEGKEDKELFVTEEMTVAYLKYDEFNKSYKELFGKDFDMKNREYSYFKSWDDKGYVYYSNRRAGSNGLFIISNDIESVLKTGKTYKAKVTLNYNDNLKEKLSTNKMIIEYKYKDNEIILNKIKFN